MYLIIFVFLLVRKDMNVHEYERLSNTYKGTTLVLLFITIAVVFLTMSITHAIQ